MLPRFTTSAPGPEFSASQLAFAAVASLALYGVFVFTQTVRHRDFFLPVTATTGLSPGCSTRTSDGHADPPPPTRPRLSLGLLVVALVAVVGLAKLLSPTIEEASRASASRTASSAS